MMTFFAPPLSMCTRALWASVKRPVDSTTMSDRKSTRLNSSHGYISYAVFCLKKKNNAASQRRYRRQMCQDEENEQKVSSQIDAPQLDCMLARLLTAI